jgi:hypothetical protein
VFADKAPWRRAAPSGELWQLFYWLGRASDQVAGIILNPLVIVLYARALEPDLVRLSWIVSGFALAWLAGSLISPWLQRLTVRVTPWVVGAYIVRTSAAALLAYAAIERSSPAEQRFRSVLICLIAYALATGVARAAHARQLSKSGVNLSRTARTFLSELGLAALIGIVGLAMFEVLASDGLTWSQSFGRVFALAAVALGVSTLSAIKSSAAQRDIAESSPATLPAADDVTEVPRTRSWSNASLLGVGLVAVSFIEAMLFLLLFQDFRRQSTDVRTAMAFFVAGWAAGALIWGVVLRRYTASLVLQVSLGCGTVAMIGALALRDLSRADWFPDDLLDRNLIVLSIYALGAVAGLSASGRREAALAFGPLQWRPTAPLVVTALIGGIMPVVVARLSEETTLEKALAAGIVVTLLVLILAGALGHDGAIRHATASLRPGTRTGALARR